MDNILENMHGSEELNTTFALYNQDTVQKNEQPSCIRLKNSVKRYLDQATKDRSLRSVFAGFQMRAVQLCNI